MYFSSIFLLARCPIIFTTACIIPCFVFRKISTELFYCIRALFRDKDIIGTVFLISFLSQIDEYLAL